MEEQYKKLNTEIINIIQKQRITIAEYIKEIQLLKKELWEEREMRHFNDCQLKNAINTMLQSIHIDLDVQNSSLQAENENEQQSRFSSNQVSSELRRSIASPSSRLSIGSPISRLSTASPSRRRSSASPRRRRSSPSPNRRTLNDENETKENAEIPIIAVTPEPRRLAELQVDYSSSLSPEVDAGEPQTDESPLYTSPTAARETLPSIIEESDWDEISVSSSSSSLQETQQQLVISSSMESSPLPLRNVTNTASTPKLTKKVDQHLRVSLKNSPLRRLPKITISRGKATRTPNDETENCTQEPSIEHVRYCLRPSSPMPTNSASPVITPSRSLFNFSDFNHIVDRPTDSSTPRQQKYISNLKTKNKSKKTQSTGIDTTIVAEPTSCSSISSRPSRACRPTSLKEPKLNSKMRNSSCGKKKNV